MAPGAEFDVAVSFAEEDRDYVRKVVEELRARGVRVFYDAAYEVELWGKDLATYLDAVYRQRSRYVVVFVSEHYVRKQWTRHELRSALARALEEKGDYVLPARFDHTDLPGVPFTVRHVDLRLTTPVRLANMVVEKLGRTGGATPGPPDAAELRERAEASARANPWSGHRTLIVTVAAGPTRRLVRPSGSWLMERAMFGDHAVLVPGAHTTTWQGDGQLTLTQTDRAIAVDDLGTVTFMAPNATPNAIERVLGLALEVLDLVDAGAALTHLVPVAAQGPAVVAPRDPAIPRAEMRLRARQVAEDLAALLSRRV